MADGKHFTCADDNLLLREALAAEIWRAERVMEAWELLARRLGGAPSFPPNKDGRAIRTRFRLLLKKFRESALESMRHAGSREELDEREDLLHEIDVEIRDVEATRGKRERSDVDAAAGEDELLAPIAFREPSERPSKRLRRDVEGATSTSTVVDRTVALLEQVLTQQQQQLAYQQEQIEKQFAMQQQQMQMIMALVEKVTRG